MLQYHFKLFILKKCTGGVYTVCGSGTVVDQSNRKPKIKGFNRTSCLVVFLIKTLCN